MQYVVFVHGNAVHPPDAASWNTFFSLARASGMFEGGSALGDRLAVGGEAPDSSATIVGYLRFTTDDRAVLEALLQQHPVVRGGGTLEIRAAPRT